MEKVAHANQRHIIFMETGYRGTTNAAAKPWEWVEYEEENEAIYSEEIQVNCYKAFFEKVWNKPWFAGVHLWQLRTDHERRAEDFKLDFTTQGKVAEETIGTYFRDIEER